MTIKEGSDGLEVQGLQEGLPGEHVDAVHRFWNGAQIDQDRPMPAAVVVGEALKSSRVHPRHHISKNRRADWRGMPAALASLERSRSLPASAAMTNRNRENFRSLERPRQVSSNHEVILRGILTYCFVNRFFNPAIAPRPSLDVARDRLAVGGQVVEQPVGG